MTECAICSELDCADTSTKHLLACFDLTFDDEGLHGAGLVGGALYKAKALERFLDAIQMARVEAWKHGGPKAPAPEWIANRPELKDYFAALGDDGFDPNDYDDVSDAASSIAGCTSSHGDQVRALLDSLLIDVGWSGITSDDEDNIPLASSSYALWWDDDAEDVAKRLGSHIADILEAA